MNLVKVKSQEYISYIDIHRAYVKAAYNTYKDFFITYFNIPSKLENDIDKQITNHDKSKYTYNEFNAYRRYFYPTTEENNQTDKNTINYFHKAWLHHIHENPHHPEHWMYYDDETNKLILLKIPDRYIIEMICDWVAMSKLDIKDMIKWYTEKGSKKKMHPDTKNKVDKTIKALIIEYKEIE